MSKMAEMAARVEELLWEEYQNQKPPRCLFKAGEAAKVRAQKEFGYNCDTFIDELRDRNLDGW